MGVPTTAGSRFAALAAESQNEQDELGPAMFPGLQDPSTWVKPAWDRARKLPRLPPRKHCRCPSHGQGAHPEPGGGSDLTPLLLETDRDHDIMTLRAGRRRRSEYEGCTKIEVVVVTSGTTTSVMPER